MRLRHLTYFTLGLMALMAVSLSAQESTGKNPAETSPEVPSFGLSDSLPPVLNPTGQIKYVIPESGTVTLEVFDIMGQQVLQLVNEEQAAGSHTVVWDGTGADGKPVLNGVYFYRLRTGGLSEMRKVLVVR